MSIDQGRILPTERDFEQRYNPTDQLLTTKEELIIPDQVETLDIETENIITHVIFTAKEEYQEPTIEIISIIMGETQEEALTTYEHCKADVIEEEERFSIKQTGEFGLSKLLLSINLPLDQKYKILLKQKDGKIDMTNMTGEVNIETKGKEVYIRGHHGSINIRQENPYPKSKVELYKCTSGEINIQTGLSEISMSQIYAGVLDITSYQGNITIGDLHLEGESQSSIETVTGKINLSIPREYLIINDQGSILWPPENIFGKRPKSTATVRIGCMPNNLVINNRRI